MPKPKKPATVTVEFRDWRDVFAGKAETPRVITREIDMRQLADMNQLLSPPRKPKP